MNGPRLVSVVKLQVERDRHRYMDAIGSLKTRCVPGFAGKTTCPTAILDATTT